ncbi:uncharacterized protein LOC142323155 isoform X2 [Lycorma delicatula]|uniref:uncharacterized protein LOC142323155 isoform X2 n=1 Tax=Lycorma delicatula TaxID=130591 RepID=UPI003F51410C
MARLTEEMVIARTRQSNLAAIKKLNCWGSELVDVSLLRRITNVEVLSLSVNKIASLADFQYCKNLQELFVRKNNIRDLNQVCYLQDLPKLRNLWLDENPCANCEGYRMAVIRCLPNLEKLDNVCVQREEVQEALKRGRELIHPEEDQLSSERSREDDPYASDELEDSSSSQNATRTEQRKSSSPEAEYYENERQESSVREYSPEPANANRRSSVQHYQNHSYEHDTPVASTSAVNNFVAANNASVNNYHTNNYSYTSASSNSTSSTSSNGTAVKEPEEQVNLILTNCSEEFKRRTSCASGVQNIQLTTTSNNLHSESSPTNREDNLADCDERSIRETHSVNSGQPCDDHTARQYHYHQSHQEHPQNQQQQQQSQYYDRRLADRPLRPPCNVDQRVRPINHQPPYHRRPTTRVKL